MKKLIPICCLLVVVVVLACSLSQCSMMYGGDEIVEEGLRYHPHSIFKTCLAADYAWPEGATEAELTIPDICGGYRVTELGGYIGKGLPCPFMVSLPEQSVVWSEGALPANAKVEAYHLVLNIGRELEEDTNIAMDWYYQIGSDRFVQILVTVNCAEDNPNFYAEEGRLYRKADDSLVEGFFYLADFEN